MIAVGVIGARGHTGAELLKLLFRHPSVEVKVAASRALAGQAVAGHVEGAPENLSFTAPTPEAVAGLDAVFLALPNGASGPYVEAAAPGCAVIDLSADHRFDAGWSYGLVEKNRARLRGARRIANPGCYATGMQLGLLPVLHLLDTAPVVFGVSGYSGAGTTPSRKNDANELRDNLMPYQLTCHLHEREVSAHLQRPVRFSPHVAPHFRGISLTLSCSFSRALSADALRDLFEVAYRGEALVEVHDAIPEVKNAAFDHRVHIGGFSPHDTRAVWVVTLDNLLKGAATQAVQNLNLALALPELSGIEV